MTDKKNKELVSLEALDEFNNKRKAFDKAQEELHQLYTSILDQIETLEKARDEIALALGVSALDSNVEKFDEILEVSEDDEGSESVVPEAVEPPVATSKGRSGVRTPKKAARPLETPSDASETPLSVESESVVEEFEEVQEDAGVESVDSLEILGQAEEPKDEWDDLGLDFDLGDDDKDDDAVDVDGLQF